MGVFNKLKEVLFDVEEEEIPVITREPKKEDVEKEPDENPIKEVKMPKEDIFEEFEPIEGEPPKEKSFNFPLDFDEEVPLRSRNDIFDDEFTSRTSLRETRREEARKKDEYEYDYSRLNIKDIKKEEIKSFKPSPIISPVYGILDQNYTKDDVIVKNDGSERKPDLDEVRKRVYSKKKAPKDDLEESLKTLDDILIDKPEEEEEIPLKKEEVVKKTKKVEEDIVLDGNTPIGELDELPVEKEVKELDKEDEIESDLFNLIDSMYEDKEESEEEE